MKHRKVTNVAASVRQRLLNEARATGRPFNELLQYFAMERFLYRLSKSPHGEKFVLKGALMLAMWEVSLTRPTKDIDLLGHVANDIDRIVAAVKDVCAQEVEPDGLDFDQDSVRGERIAEEGERLERLGLPFSSIRFAGGHELQADVLRGLATPDREGREGGEG